MNQQNSQGSGLAPNVASLLCYVCSLVTGVIFLLLEKENKDVKFHAWQAIFLGGSAIVLQVVLSILVFIFSKMAGFLGAIFGFIVSLVWLGYLILWIVCMIKAYQGERFKIPFIGDLAEKQALK